MLHLQGLWTLPWWGYLLFALIFTHITITGVTIYLHRSQAHRALELRAPLAHFYRFWLWLTTGMVTKEWVAIHRKHHAQCEMEGDPHSPIVWLRGVEGKWNRALAMVRFVLWVGVLKYVRESHVSATMERYGAQTPDDWVEHNVYSRFPKVGVSLMLIVNLLCFGIWGVLIWGVQMLWIPIFAAGVINGVGHYLGYRNFESKHRKTGVVDSSKNILPWGILIGGEELHNNHHANEVSPKLSAKWFEFDIGWCYINLFRLLGLVKSIRLDRPFPV